jgi:subtilisin family serine protease
MGEAQDLIVLFDDADVENEATALRRTGKKEFDDDAVLAVRRERYRTIKQSVRLKRQSGDIDDLRDYDHLPMLLVRANSRAALDRLLADPRVKAVYEDLPVYPHLAYSLPFIGQPAVASAGYSGSGQTVAVIDTGINYTLSAFGSCTAPGVPASCRVAAAVDVDGIDNLVTTANNHGTNVSGIVAGVATGTKIASFNALPGGTGSTSDVIAGIEWAIANKATYNITAINMSIGDGSKNLSLCSSTLTNPFKTPLDNARTAGIIPVASSGNNGYTNGIGKPACTPGVVSVGAVYDASWGGPYSWGGTPPTCTDSAASAADKIPCFSNSASFLTMLAPGAYITAAGIQMAGTSQAAPHVAGAIAVLRAAYPAETIDQIVTRLTSGGVSITDPRNKIAKPRLNLLSAVIDATLPVVSITAPSQGSTVSDTVTVSAGASDNIGVNRVEFYLDSVLVNTDTSDPYSFNWDTTSVAAGLHSLKAIAFDAAGNRGESGVVTVSVTNAVSQPEAVPALSTWGLLVAALSLAGVAGRTNKRSTPNTLKSPPS